MPDKYQVFQCLVNRESLPPTQKQADTVVTPPVQGLQWTQARGTKPAATATSGQLEGRKPRQAVGFSVIPQPWKHRQSSSGRG